MRVQYTIILLSLWMSGARMPDTPVAPSSSDPAPLVAGQSSERSAVGTLDHVDATASQIVVGTATGTLTFQVQRNATIRQGSRTVKPAELASHKGERVKIRYRENNGQRHTDWIMLAAPARR